MNETFIPSLNSKKRKWYLIDCKNQKLGRIATVCVGLLSGKLKSYYHPSFDTGDYVILTNAEFLTVDRNVIKLHVYRPGRPGHSLKRLTNALPEFLIEKCIYGMMPNGNVKRHLNKRLKIYQGSKHPHIAQNVIKLDNFNKFK